MSQQDLSFVAQFLRDNFTEVVNLVFAASFNI